MGYTTAIAGCDDYSPEAVNEAFDRVLEPLGGLDWVEPGMRIAIKTNLVGKMKPESAAVTHPALLTELCRRLAARGAEVTVGDSPSGPWNPAWVNGIYAASGVKAVETAGARLNRDYAQCDVSFPEGHTARSFPYTAWLNDADAVIDFCKLKTHGLMGMTCAVKNMYGVIPGTRKPEFHYLYSKIDDFSNMLVDLNQYVRPRMTFVDAVDCMEGNGPTQGKPRHMGALIASGSTYAADILCAELIGFRPLDVPTTRAAHERGLCPGSVEEITVFGDWKRFVIPDFEKLPLPKTITFMPDSKLINSFLEHALHSRPKVLRDKCVGCGKCAGLCPRKTITVEGGKAVINRKSCIRCFCCQEFCPMGAIEVHRPFIARLIGK